MGFEEIRAGLNPIYYVKSEYNEMIGDRHWVYAHYRTTQPDTPYMVFKHKENAELFCRVMNAENSNIPYFLAFER